MFALLASMLLAVDEPVPVVAPPILRPIIPVISPPPVITPINPAPPAPPVVTVARKAQGRTHPAALFSEDDYPISAIRNGEEGTVGAELLVGPDGRVAGCSIFVSSGSSTLDQATCAILTRRARFTPPRDRAGAPISDRSRVRIRWELPDATPFADTSERTIVQFDSKGLPTGCRKNLEARDSFLACGDHLLRAVGLVSGHPDLGKRPLAIIFEERFEAQPGAPTPPVGAGRGERLISREVAEFDIDSGGVVVNCRVASTEGKSPENDLCEKPLYDYFVPLSAAQGELKRRGRTTNAAYLKR